MMEDKSEWHEQVEFSELYFKEHIKCREAQRLGDAIAWVRNSESEMSMAMGVLAPTEKERIMELKSKLRFEYNNYINSLSFEERSGRIPLDSMSDTLKDKLLDKLFEIESEVDTMVNKRMPFLNIKKEVSIKGM